MPRILCTITKAKNLHLQDATQPAARPVSLVAFQDLDAYVESTRQFLSLFSLLDDFQTLSFSQLNPEQYLDLKQRLSNLRTSLDTLKNHHTTLKKSVGNLESNEITLDIANPLNTEFTAEFIQQNTSHLSELAPQVALAKAALQRSEAELLRTMSVARGLGTEEFYASKQNIHASFEELNRIILECNARSATYSVYYFIPLDALETLPVRRNIIAKFTEIEEKLREDLPFFQSLPLLHTEMNQLYLEIQEWVRKLNESYNAQMSEHTTVLTRNPEILNFLTFPEKSIVKYFLEKLRQLFEDLFVKEKLRHYEEFFNTSSLRTAQISNSLPRSYNFEQYFERLREYKEENSKYENLQKLQEAAKIGETAHSFTRFMNCKFFPDLINFFENGTFLAPAEIRLLQTRESDLISNVVIRYLFPKELIDSLITFNQSVTEIINQLNSFIEQFPNIIHFYSARTEQLRPLRSLIDPIQSKGIEKEKTLLTKLKTKQEEITHFKNLVTATLSQFSALTFDNENNLRDKCTAFILPVLSSISPKTSFKYYNIVINRFYYVNEQVVLMCLAYYNSLWWPSTFPLATQIIHCNLHNIEENIGQFNAQVLAHINPANKFNKMVQFIFMFEGKHFIGGCAHQYASAPPRLFLMDSKIAPIIPHQMIQLLKTKCAQLHIEFNLYSYPYLLGANSWCMALEFIAILSKPQSEGLTLEVHAFQKYFIETENGRSLTKDPIHQELIRNYGIRYKWAIFAAHALQDERFLSTPKGEFFSVRMQIKISNDFTEYIAPILPILKILGSIPIFAPGIFEKIIDQKALQISHSRPTKMQ